MFKDFINWIKDKYLYDMLWKITKFQLVYLGLTIMGDFGNEIVVGFGTIFKIAALAWCIFSIWIYLKNETDLMETYSVSRRLLFTMTLIVWCVEAVIWGNLITKLATADWWIIPQKGLSVQNIHNGGEYLTMACVLIYTTLLVGLILKALQRYWWPFKEGRDDEVSNILVKIGEMFLKPVDINLGKNVCIIITITLVLFGIYPFIDLFIMSSDNVLNSKKDYEKYLRDKYKIEKLEETKVLRDKKDYKYHQYETKKGEKHSVAVEQKYVVPKLFEKGVPRWEVKIIVDGEEIKID